MADNSTNPSPKKRAHLAVVKKAAPISMLEAALAYAKRGWPVFPCHSIVNGKCTCGKPDCSSPGKHPRTKNGFKDATTDEATIREWWRKWPNANIGIATGSESGLFVLDIDPEHGGEQSLQQLKDKYGPLPETARVRTGSGGWHYYFRYPAGLRLPNSSSKLGPGIDTRGDGGYVIAPPSLHVSGRRYEWVEA
jgi:hypothetical protein